MELERVTAETLKKRYRAADELQLIIGRYFERDRGPSKMSIGNLDACDLEFVRDGAKVEIKLDTKARETFNGAVEYWSLRDNKPTGILNTSAKAWIHVVPEGADLHAFVMDVPRLRRLCFETGEVGTGGDNGSSVMKLIPLDKLKEIARHEFLIDGSLMKHVKYW